VGDMMTSRWAFEAAMVAQFKDNEFEEDFYAWDKAMAEADYKKIYFIPELESRLDYINLHHTSSDPLIRGKVTDALILLEREVSKELDRVGRKNLPDIDRLTLKGFDSTTYVATRKFLEILKRTYVTRYNHADQLKENYINSITQTAAAEKEFEVRKSSYTNDAISDLVKNTIETNRIIEHDNKLVQKIFPIYKDPDPDHLVDFDAQFYMPKKHFLNQNIDTYFFNNAVIWTMTLILMITLYFDWLRKIIDGLGNLGNRAPKRM